MGPGDRFLKWRLTANIMVPEPSCIGVGSLVYHPRKDEQEYALVTQLDGDNMCTLSSNDESSFRWELNKLRPYEGEVDFEVYRMNVQGGGIVKCTCTREELLSLRWLDAVTEIEGEEDGFHSGCWYFDPTQKDLDLARMANTPEVAESRNTITRTIEEGVNLNAMLATLQQALTSAIVNHISDEALDIVPFQKGLFSVPILIYLDTVTFIFDLYRREGAQEQMGFDLTDDDWCLIFYSMVKIGVYLWNDEEWHRSNANMEAQIGEMSASQGQGIFEAKPRMDASMYQMLNRTGELYEEMKEFRAAIWCYSQTLESVGDPTVKFFPDHARKDCLVHVLSYLGLANKRMDNFAEASRYYDEAIVACKSSNLDVSSYALLQNTKMLQSAAKDWFGSYGRFTKWETYREDSLNGEKICSTCGAGGASKKCAACHLACFCDADCQRSHWKKVHKLTCLGRLRGK